MTTTQPIHPDRFFAGFLAGLRLVHTERLAADRTRFNRAFYEAITHAPLPFSVDALEIDYDPLYGVSHRFERQLTRAQRDLLISFPNPTYAVVDIKLREDQAERLLEQIGNRAAFVALAQAFLAGLPQKNTATA